MEEIDLILRVDSEEVNLLESSENEETRSFISDLVT